MAQQDAPASSMAVPHGPDGVGLARRRLRADLLARGAVESDVDDAVLVLSELLSNACRHARPLALAGGGEGGLDGDVGPTRVRAEWRVAADGGITVAVTDGGGPTRPLPASPSVTARGGRGLAIISSLATEWGVEAGEDADGDGAVRVWASLGG